MAVNLITSNYRSSFRFLHQRLNLIAITSVAFIGAMLLTLFLLQNIGGVKEILASYMADIMAQISPDDTAHDLFLFIFTNNLRAMTTMIAMGVLPFVFMPIISIVVNGSMISFVALISWEKGLNIAAFLGYILPHGIIEIPLLILSCALGFYLCLSLTKKIISEVSIKEALINIFRTYVLIILPGILVAALIEAYITPYIGSLFM